MRNFWESSWNPTNAEPIAETLAADEDDEFKQWMNTRDTESEVVRDEYVNNSRSTVGYGAVLRQK